MDFSHYSILHKRFQALGCIGRSNLLPAVVQADQDCLPKWSMVALVLSVMLGIRDIFVALLDG